MFTSEPFEFQRIGPEAARMGRLGMSLRVYQVWDRCKT